MSQTKEQIIAEIMGGIVAWVIVIACGFLTTYYAAFVMGYHWQWFLEPAGIATPPLSARLGMMLIASLFIVAPLVTIKMVDINPPADAPPRKYTPKHAAFVRIAFIAAGITMIWGIGFFWHWWLG